MKTFDQLKKMFREMNELKGTYYTCVCKEDKDFVNWLYQCNYQPIAKTNSTVYWGQP